ncbi:hypothetical protein [Alteromonas sp. a30]|uniref:hypothetical protein n=1 Tax=Alteromonas sp. a30 TaxID=2730917 RepID=UPI002281C20A|nr:hypothetical protein [Alteromonas sp. a30]MCY7295071.1 hypothetical protein [Alteromonas sp. a30]
MINNLMNRAKHNYHKTADAIGDKAFRVGLALTGGFVATGVNAADYTSLITTAETDATANNSAGIAAYVTIALLGFGVGWLVTWLKR